MAVASKIAQLDGQKFKNHVESMKNKPINHEENLKRFGKK